jgi:hypothetical protein
MIQDRLWLEVEKVADRYQQLRFWRALTVGWLVAAVIGLGLGAVGIATAHDLSSAWPVLGGVAAVLVVICAWLVKALAPGHDWVARQIEAEFPDLHSCLLAAVEQQPALADGRFGFLQESVIRQALVHAACHPWPQVVPTRRLAWAVATQCVTLGLFVLTLTNMPASAGRMEQMAGSPKSSPAVEATDGFSVAVEPGDAEIERGTSLLVLARVTGEMPADATLVMQPAAGDASNLAMSRSLDDPVFGGRIAKVTEAFDYHVELGSHQSKTYRITVFEYPRLERADARLVYPSYTGLEERLVQDVRTVSVVEGTQVTLICNLNKPVKSATLTPKGGEPIILTTAAGERPVYQVTLTAEKSQRLKLELIDESGRKNVEQSEIAINVVPNKPPTLKLVQPARDLEVSPLEELDVKATAWDDFGLKRMGVSFAIAGQQAVDVILGENAAAKQKHEIANAIKFEELKAEPDQLLSYHFWAEDVGPDGNVRRTSSDMYFAEVRHFEEIFRQGQQPPGGQQQQQQQQQQQNSPAGQQAQQLAQNQKDIINATWKLIRRETGSKTTEPFAEDVEQLVTAQNALLEKAKGLAEKVTDEQSQAHVDAVIAAMLEAVKQLMTAHDAAKPADVTRSVSEGEHRQALQLALAAEQSAYQALLKLRAREHEVVRQQQQQQQSSQQSQSQQARSQQQRQQMQQLDLKNEENRYETQRQAQQQQQESAEDRENRQVLNRLKELAQRQHDLNERLKDLQTALQEAQTAERKEEIKQQLKRLQDEQRQVLRDTDELQARMENSENQERMADERQQLEQTRDQVRRASEALENEQVTQAAASGTRAEKDFEELRNEFRRRASNRFNDEMREMRQSARDLDQDQKKLSEQLAEVTQPDAPKADGKKASPKSLREDNKADDIVKGLNEQKEKLTNLNERMKQTIEEAEQSEPLLTERLYETARNLQSQNVDRALEAAGRSLQRGLMQDAQQVEKIAGKGITQLKEGVEKAAEAVLGDEAEALRRAREELKNLSQELNREIARNAPNEASQLPRDRERERGRQGDGEPNAERNPNGEQQPGERQQGQPRPGENPNGERQPGQQPNGQQPNGQRPGEQQPQEGQQPGQQRGRGQQPNERQPNESQRGQQPGNGQQPNERQPGEQPNGQQPGQQPGNQPQRGQQPGQQPGERQPGQPQEGQPQSGQQSNQLGQPGQQPQDGQRQQGQPQPGQRGQRGQQRLADNNNQNGGRFQFDGGNNREFAPISGEDFLNWSDRLRDVEEMVDDPELRAEAARIRDQARAIRAEMKRHSKEPNWGLVRVNVAEPLVELSNRVSDELLRRNSKQAIVPLDRDPVPPKYSEKTRRYYERLGSGK